MTRVAVIGVGLIGGSLGLRLKRAGFADEVVGCGRTAANLELARERGLIDRFTHDPEAAVAGADVVVLGTPVRTLKELMASLGEAIPARAVVTDVGSVKAPVVEWARDHLAHPERFVAGHPIAGTEDSGAAAADPGLFEGARWILTPDRTTDADAIARVEAMAAAAGARVERMDAARHDEIFGWVSHLPHLIAFALAEALHGTDDGLMAYGGGGLREFLRVAASDPVMWRDVFLANREALAAGWRRTAGAAEDLLAAIDEPAELEAKLAEIRAAVRANRGDDGAGPAASGPGTAERKR